MQENVAKNGWELTKVARIGRSPSLYGQKRVMRGGVGQSHEPKLSVCCLYTSAHPFLAKNRPGAPVFGYCPFFFLGKPRKKRRASLARLMIIRIVFCTLSFISYEYVFIMYQRKIFRSSSSLRDRGWAFPFFFLPCVALERAINLQFIHHKIHFVIYDIVWRVGHHHPTGRTDLACKKKKNMSAKHMYVLF